MSTKSLLAKLGFVSIVGLGGLYVINKNIEDSGLKIALGIPIALGTGVGVYQILRREEWGPSPYQEPNRARNVPARNRP